jgi:hypothetical protein
MKASTAEWIEKAEGDWDVAQYAYRARKRPNYNAACCGASFAPSLDCPSDNL